MCVFSCFLKPKSIPHFRKSGHLGLIGHLTRSGNPPTFRLGVSDLVLGGGLPPPTPSALNPVPAEWPGNAQNASACQGKRLDRGLKTLKTRTPRGYYFGGLQPFSPCLSMKRASRNAPQANKPMMAFSPTCRWKGHFERFRRPWGSKHFTKALGSLGDRAPLGLSNPFP